MNMQNLKFVFKTLVVALVAVAMGRQGRSQEPSSPHFPLSGFHGDDHQVLQRQLSQPESATRLRTAPRRGLARLSMHAISAAAVPGAETEYDLASYAIDVENALGKFNSVTTLTNNGGKWEPAPGGYYVPITVNGKEPATYTPTMACDRPIMLPLHNSPQSQSVPYSVVGRITGSNPEVQWVYVVRQYTIKQPTDSDFDQSPDVAIIGHHPRTGSTAFFQWYGPGRPKSASTIPSPWTAAGTSFWDTPTATAQNGCASCHNADPFVHSPWLQQARLPSGDCVVPSDPLGPYSYLASEPGKPFNRWENEYPAQYLNVLTNKCTECHRISPYDGAHLYKFSTLNMLDSHQTSEYKSLHWMPPVNSLLDSYYAGQSNVADFWNQFYGTSAAAVDALTQSSPDIASTPNPPAQYRVIVVDRPIQDTLSESKSIWIVDTRMRANTDGNLMKWKFFGKGNDAKLTVAPVVYEKIEVNSPTFRVKFVGTPQNATQTNTWINVSGSTATPLAQGDYFGILVSNANSSGTSNACVPFTNDDWAVLKFGDSAERLRAGSVVYYTEQLPMVTPAGLGQTQLTFNNAAYRTYSFEFQSALAE